MEDLRKTAVGERQTGLILSGLGFRYQGSVDDGCFFQFVLNRQVVGTAEL